MNIIDLSSDALDVRVLPHGAALVGVRFAGRSRNLVLGFADPEDHARLPVFAGHLAGPVANRVRAGRVVLEGQAYQMPLNEAGLNTLHSGPDGLHAQNWLVTAQTPSSVTLQCTLKDGQCGLPGTRVFTTTYAITGSTLRLTIEVTTDNATPFNVAAHPYWNLDGNADVSGHSLHIPATTYLPTDPQNLPTGAPAPVQGTLYDFTAPRPVPLDPALDSNFCLGETMRDTPSTAATLAGGDGTTLRIATTCPGLQVYNGAHLPLGAAETADFPAIGPYAGIAMEPQHWPDAPHHAHFPQITVQPGETYRQITEYHLQRG